MDNNNLTIDDLARMIKNEFDNVQNQFDNVQKQFKNVQKEFDGINSRLDVNDRNIEEIKMKMAYVAWQIDMDEVKERLRAVERKAGIKN